MGGGRDKNGTPIYRRIHGIYIRLDGKPVNYRKSLTTVVSSKAVISPRTRASETPLPQNGREVKGFFEKTKAIDDLNDSSTGSYVSKPKRKDPQLYEKLIDGRFETENGGLLFQSERVKNSAYMKYNDMPSYQDVLNQVIPQLTPQNLKQVKEANISTAIDGNIKMWVYETFVTNNENQQIRTYVKVMPMHSNDGKPYMILVSLHKANPIHETATSEEKGL